MKVTFFQESKKRPVMVTTEVRGDPDSRQTRKATEEDKIQWGKAWEDFNDTA